MAIDPRKRQKKLEQRAAKRKEKKQAVRRRESAGLSTLMRSASQGPVLHCFASDSLEDGGMGWVVISREMPHGMVAFASFLIDRYCLGVKNVHADIVSRPAYVIDFLRPMRAKISTHNVEPADARKLVEQAVAYARGLGFAPHSEYAGAAILFGSIDASQSDAQFEFGKDGKPYFISGPYDSPARCRQIMATLERNCGPSNYHYLVGVPVSADGEPMFGEIRPGEMHLLEEAEILDEDEE